MAVDECVHGIGQVHTFHSIVDGVAMCQMMCGGDEEVEDVSESEEVEWPGESEYQGLKPKEDEEDVTSFATSEKAKQIDKI